MYICYHRLARYICLLLLTTVTLSVRAANQRLFHIGRSDSHNMVCYDVQLNGKVLNVQAPIRAYWINPDVPGGSPSDLNLLEKKMAYGIKVKRCTVSEASFVLSAYKDRVIRVYQERGKWVAVTFIGGEECYISDIFVKIRKLIGVESVELRGVSISQGIKKKELIKK